LPGWGSPKSFLREAFFSSQQADNRTGLTVEFVCRILSGTSSNTLQHKHAGILSGEMDLAPSIDLDITHDNGFVFAEHDGLFEQMIDLGQGVEEGDFVAWIWPVDRTGMRPFDYHAQRSGILAGRHFPGLVQAGDCMAVISTIVP
jgi:predicted deacylase